MREKKYESESTFQRIKNQVADQTCNGNQTVQRGNRIIVIDDFFATPFSLHLNKVFMQKFCDQIAPQLPTFYDRKQLS